MNPFKTMMLTLLLALIGACTHYIDAEPFSKIKSGKTFDRQGTYRISPGDQVNVLVYGEPNLSGDYIVSLKRWILVDPSFTPYSGIWINSTANYKKGSKCIKRTSKKTKGICFSNRR